MARKKVSPEAQIIALFTGLSDESKRMVMFGLNAIMSNGGPKLESAHVQSAAKKSSRKGAATNSTANTEVEMASATAVGASGGN